MIFYAAIWGMHIRVVMLHQYSSHPSKLYLCWTHRGRTQVYACMHASIQSCARDVLVYAMVA